jgi:hypothetical protein
MLDGMRTTTVPRASWKNLGAAATALSVTLAGGVFVALASVPAQAAVGAGSDSLPTGLRPAGSNAKGQWNIPPALANQSTLIGDVSAGTDHALAVSSVGGTLYAWGDQSHGEGFVPLPLREYSYKAVSAGANYSLALTRSGKVAAWGNNADGVTSVPDELRLPDPPKDPEDPPPPPGRTVTAISAGGSFALALDSLGVVHAWGNPQWDVLFIPPEIQGKVVKIAAGGSFAVAVTDENKVVVWGFLSDSLTKPPASLQGRPIAELDVGALHAAALLADGSIVTWGDNTSGQLNVPTPDTADKRWQHVSAGADFTVGVSASPTLQVWGNTAAFTTPTSMTAPSRVAAGGDFVIFGEARLAAAHPPGSIQGSGRVGEQLTGTLGTFTPLAPTEVWGSWFLADGPETLGPTYTPTADQVGKKLTFRTNGHLAGYLVGENDVSLTVQPGVLTPSGKPTIAGRPRVGQVLTASASFAPVPDRLQYDWYVDGVSKPATEEGRYTVQPGDLGKRITVQVTAKKNGYTDAASGLSDATDAVTAALPQLNVTREATLPGVARVGGVVGLTPPTTEPAATSVAYQWLRGNEVIPGATGASYTPTPADRGGLLAVRATLSRDGYDDATSLSTGIQVQDGVFAVVGLPLITGTPLEGATLHASISSTPAAESVQYDWYAGETLRASGPGDYLVTSADAGLRMTVRARLTRQGYAPVSSERSAPTDVVQALSPLLPPIRVTRAATVSGAAVAGRVLTAQPPRTDVAGVATYQWLRAGRVVAGATARTYRAGAADVGRRLSVVVTVRRDGHLPASSTAVVSKSTAKARPRLSATARLDAKRLVVTVRAAATGLSPLRGRVVVQSGHKILKRATLVRGRVVISLPRTSKPLKVTLSATAATSRRTTSVSRVRGRVAAPARRVIGRLDWMGLNW